MTVFFCNERESIVHLFFECCMAINLWSMISELLGQILGKDFESIARFWVSNKRHKATKTNLSGSFTRVSFVFNNLPHMNF